MHQRRTRVASVRPHRPPRRGRREQVAQTGAPAPLGFAERTPPAVGRRDPPSSPIRHRFADITRLVCEEPMPELGVVAVRVEQRVRTIRLHHLARGDRVGQPPVVGLTRELEDPTRHRHRDPCSGELNHERVEPFPGRFACDKYAAARRRTSFSCSRSRIRCAPPAARWTRSGSGRALSLPRPRRGSTTSATSSGERRSLSRSARSSLRPHGSSRRARRHHGTRWDRAWAQQHPSRPPSRASQIKCHLSVQLSQGIESAPRLWASTLAAGGLEQGWSMGESAPDHRAKPFAKICRPVYCLKYDLQR